METGLTLTGIASLAGVLLLGALVPGVSVLAVSARSASLGLPHGLLTAAGIVTGDILFILFALYGLTTLYDWLGDDFSWIRLLGGAYLIWLGLLLWRARPETNESQRQFTRASSFSSGLLITLADQKAIIFYFGLFPAFIEPGTLTGTDTLLILVIALLAVGGPKVLYAYLANRAGQSVMTSRAGKRINVFAGGVMAGVGLMLLIRAF